MNKRNIEIKAVLEAVGIEQTDPQLVTAPQRLLTIDEYVDEQKKQWSEVTPEKINYWKSILLLDPNKNEYALGVLKTVVNKQGIGSGYKISTGQQEVILKHVEGRVNQSYSTKN